MGRLPVEHARAAPETDEQGYRRPRPSRRRPQPQAAHQAALRVAQNDLDLRLRYQPVVKTDLARLQLWARQLLVDAADRNPDAVAGDVATLELIRDRVRHTLHPATATRLDTQLRDLGDAADNKDVAATAKATPALLATLAAT